MQRGVSLVSEPIEGHSVLVMERVGGVVCLIQGLAHVSDPIHRPVRHVVPPGLKRAGHRLSSLRIIVPDRIVLGLCLLQHALLRLRAVLIFKNVTGPNPHSPAGDC